MIPDLPYARAAAAYGPAALAAGLLLLTVAALCWIIARRTSGAVLTASIGALVCTLYTADTSWRFAEHRLGMIDPTERLVMFAAGEIALLACAVMARANKQATATDDTAGTPGVPGVLVWAITGAQVIPAYTESGFWGGTVRAFFGPVMAGLLWHLAMGLEIRVTKPQALSSGLPAQIGAELRERLLSRLGLATRGRTAVQISRDRATARAVRLASRRWLSPWGRAALKASVARSGAAVHGEQRHHLMQLLAGRRSAAELRTVPVASPWVAQPVPEPYPRTPLGVTGAELRRLDPFDAVLRVHDAHPTATPAELAELCTGYGVPVTETRVRMALRAADPDPVPAPAPAVPPAPERPQIEPGPTPGPEPWPDPWPEEPHDEYEQPQVLPDVPDREYTARGLHLDITTAPEVHREVLCAVPAAMTRTRPTRTQVHARIPAPPAVLHVPETPGEPTTRKDGEDTVRNAQDRTAERPVPGVPVPEVQPVPAPAPQPTGTPGTGTGDPVLARAREVDAVHRRTHNRPASIRVLKQELGIGQKRAQAIRTRLDGATP
ncbi:hypothetical protein IHE56_15165 [Streptomyces sp. ID01-12c]|uniref:hypothetical protein n=1 Tax=Streptomyces caniscabiei TaxID=2746961 RepID=UPI001785ED04|nr:hypothetical protein [Streptomyces caniscabiei]MBD9703397.1 hypothetical protein [Streptomyces caniscabiei]MDX3726887.1 hypothetical protein [Streptomyces caniscabiei]